MIDVDESQLSPGKLLLQGRLQAGLTQEQVAKELYMTLSKVKALESDEYGRLNSDTFARGYIRAYANLLKLDVVKVLAAYEQQAQDVNIQKPVNQIVQTKENAHKGTWQFLVFIGAFFIGLWLISVWFFDNHSETEYASPTTNISSLSANIDNLPAVYMSAGSSSLGVQSVTRVYSTSSSSLVFSSSSSATSKTVIVKNNLLIASAKATNGSSDSSSSVSSVLSQIQNAAEAKITNSEERSIENTKKNTLDEIDFSFRGESWLEVSDSRGDVLATELQASGSKLKLAGKAPFDVKLGNAPAVDIQLNGKKIDVIPLLGSNVLILKVGN